MIQKKTIVRQKNIITQSKRIWTPLMTTCFVQILGEFEERYDTWKALSPKNFFGDLDYEYLCHYDFEAAEIDADHTLDIKKAMLALAKEGLYTEEEDRSWKYVNIIGETSYLSPKKKFSVDLNHKFVQYLVLAKECGNYTSFSPFIAKQFSGKYTERFYEFICQYRRTKEKIFFLEVYRLREMFGLNEPNKQGKLKYARYNDFVKRVIKPSIEEMKSLYDEGSCDVYFECFVKDEDLRQTGGRPIVEKIWFKIHERNKLVQKVKEIPLTNRLSMMEASNLYNAFETVLRRIYCDKWGKNYHNLIKMPLAILLRNDRNKFEKLMNTVISIEAEQSGNQTINNIQAYVRKIMEKSYNIVPQKIRE